MIHFLNLFEMREALVVIGSVLLGYILLAGHLGEKKGKTKEEGILLGKDFYFRQRFWIFFFNFFTNIRDCKAREEEGIGLPIVLFIFGGMID
jgi:hypothetical protein